jgi:SAM-dependent methyltransferase
MNPQYGDRTLASFYTRDYYSGSSGFSYVDERIDYKFYNYVWNARIRKILKYSRNGNFLDVGCSFGGFLQCASRYFTPYGIEISKYSADHAKTVFGKNIFNGTVENAPFKNNSFDVITMIEVAEHLGDPRKTFSIAFSLLKKNGLLVIQTADMNAWQAINAGDTYHYFLPGHLSYFSEESLRRLLTGIGFSKIHVYRPVEFGLLPKLLKSRASFKKITDYFKWKQIIFYHIKGFFRFKGKPLTSSMVVYAVK